MDKSAQELEAKKSLFNSAPDGPEKVKTGHVVKEAEIKTAKAREKVMKMKILLEREGITARTVKVSPFATVKDHIKREEIARIREEQTNRARDFAGLPKVQSAKKPASEAGGAEAKKEGEAHAPPNEAEAKH